MPESADTDQSDIKESARVSDVRPVQFNGVLDAGIDLSGAAVIGDYLVLGADEGHMLQILLREGDSDNWRLHRKIPLAKKDQETDIEAITFGAGHLYVVGSHSARRRRMRPDLSVRRNRERLLVVKGDGSRDRLFRIPFKPETGELGKVENISLRKRIKKDPLLQTFHGIPSKENGIDIEGVAFSDGRLLLGFRGPVLRGNFVPLMKLVFDSPKSYELIFVQLEGQGIRDLVALESGFLILSGPVNDAPGPFCLWWWDGQDQIPGKGHEVGAAVRLGEISTAGGAKAEGLALLKQRGECAELIVVYETETSMQAVRMSVRVPQ